MKCSNKQAQSEMGKKQKREIRTDTNEALVQFRPWADLPTDILSSISVRLTISDELLSFRRTCKGFHSASTNIGSCRGPWILFHKTDSPECQIYNRNGSKIFKRNIPDLEGATCLASYLGWLLLSKQKLVFFFCPFSFAKITLPKFRNKDMESLVATFTDLPTSPHCMVSIINKTDIGLTVHVISNGKTGWKQVRAYRACEFPDVFSFTFTAATFDHTSQSFCYFDSTDLVRTFAVKDKSWNAYYMNKGKKWIQVLNNCIPILPCYYTRDMFHDMIKEKRRQFDLEDDEYVSVCGLTYKDNKSRQIVYQNEVVDASPMKTSMRRAVWIQPRFYEARMNLRWKNV